MNPQQRTARDRDVECAFGLLIDAGRAKESKVAARPARDPLARTLMPLISLGGK
jgi:hypothetical protein